MTLTPSHQIRFEKLDARGILFFMPYLDLNDGRIYYEVAGQDEPFVMLHAGIAHAAMWDPQFEYFAGTYQVVRFDQRGFGKTTSATQDINRRADLLAVLDHLHLDRVILMGCSMGGSLALDFTLEHPERVAALVLIAAGISGVHATPDLTRLWEEQEAAIKAGEIERGIELELKMWVDGPNRTAEQVDPAVRAKVREMELENLEIANTDYNSAALEPPALGRLAEVRVPTLVIYGTGDQPLVVENGQTLTREIPHAQTLIFEKLGHVPSMEKPEAVNHAIETFLNARAK